MVVREGETMSRILTDDEVFDPYNYKDEAELETLAREYFKDMFGESLIYLDIKRMMKGHGVGVVSIPDGLALETNL